MADNYTIIFHFSSSMTAMQCKKTDLIDDVFNKFCQNALVNQKDIKFYLGSKEFTYRGKTLEQLNIKNITIFDVVIEKIDYGA